MVLIEPEDGDGCTPDMLIKYLTGVGDEGGGEGAAKEVDARKGRCTEKKHGVLWSESGVCDGLKEG